MNITKSIFVLLIASSVAVSASSYEVHVIDPFPGCISNSVEGINNSGTVLGNNFSTIDFRGAFTWNVQSGVGAIYPPATIDSPAGIGNDGRVVGGYLDDFYNWYAVVSNTDGTITHLASLPSDVGSFAGAINDSGQIAGYSGDASHAVIWNADGTLVEIGGADDWRSSACDINNLSEVVWNTRNSLNGSVSVAYRWTATGNSTLLSPFNNSDYTLARAINNLGQIVGTSGNHAIVWNRDGSIAADLGVGEAFDINNLGQIVGTLGGHAVTWETNGSVVDLPSLLSGNGSIYGRSLKINDHGQIIGAVYNELTGNSFAAYLQPVPEPSSLLALAGGLGCLGVAFRRRH